MADDTTELNERFERYCDTKDHQIPPEVLHELQSMISLYSISAEELDFKWQAYNMKMGEESKMDAKTTKDFKKTIQDALERESRGKAQQRNDVKRGQPTPRAKAGGDMYDMYAEGQIILCGKYADLCRLEGLVPNTPRPGPVNAISGSTIKRKNNFQTPSSKANKAHEMSSPGGMLTPRTETGGAYAISMIVLDLLLKCEQCL